MKLVEPRAAHTDETDEGNEVIEERNESQKSSIFVLMADTLCQLYNWRDKTTNQFSTKHHIATMIYSDLKLNSGGKGQVFFKLLNNETEPTLLCNCLLYTSRCV